MKNTPTNPGTCGRNPELGAIAIIVAAMWMTLFGLAAFAVDIGYGYTNKRGLKAVADAGVRAGMKTYATSDKSSAAQATAISAATAVADANGYPTGVNVTFPSSRLQVDITMTQPTFFLKLFGFATKPISARSSGQILTAGGPAIYSNDGSACGGQWDNSKGIDVAGNGFFRVNGNVESKNKVHFGNPNPGCNGVICQVTGTVTTPCTFWNDTPAAIGVGSTSTSVPTNPMPTFASLAGLCTDGDLATAHPGVPCNPDASCPGGCLVPNGIYCSITDFNIAPGAGTNLCTNGASFFSAGAVRITGDGSITLNPHPASGGIVAYSNFAGGGPAIQLSNGVAFGYTVNGSVFAPLGLVNVGTGTPGFTMTGTLGGNVVNISMGNGQPWTFNGPGGSGSTWQMYE